MTRFQIAPSIYTLCVNCCSDLLNKDVCAILLTIDFEPPMRVYKTFLLGMLYFAMGMFAELSGPTLSDLKYLYNTNYVALTQAMAGRSIGGIVGALLGGALVDKYEHKTDIYLSILSLISAMGVFYVTSAHDVDAIWYGYFAQGFALCFMGILNMRRILILWENRSSTVVQLMLMVYGIGALVIPLICSPFLTNTGNLQPNITENHSASETYVHVPYMLVSAYLLLISVLFVASHVKSNETRTLHSVRKEKPSTLINIEDIRIKQHKWSHYIYPTTFTNCNFQFGSVVIGILFVYYFNYAGCEKVFGIFVRTFSIDVFDLSTNQASYINTVFWFSFTLGRLIISILTRFIPTRVLLLINVVLHFLSVWFMKNYATVSLPLFWMSTFVEGLLMAPLYGLVISYGNTLVDIKGMYLTVIILASSLGQWFYVSCAGTFYDKYGPTAVIHWMGVPSSMVLFSAVILVIVNLFKQ